MFRPFVKLITEVCQKNGWSLETFCDEWVLRITNQENKVVTLVGYSFPLNTHIAASLANDKGLTNDFLESAKIPHIKNHFIYSDSLRARFRSDISLEEDVENFLKEQDFPIVVKPCKGQGGQGVVLCKDKDELLEATKNITTSEDVCLSPFEEGEFETRVYILDDKILLAYKKRRVNNWKHNLSSGTVPQIIEIEGIPEVVDLARKAVKALGIRAASVDVFDTREGLKILEVNNGISLAHFASLGEENHKIAVDVYERYLLKSFDICK